MLIHTEQQHNSEPGISDDIIGDLDCLTEFEKEHLNVSGVIKEMEEVEPWTTASVLGELLRTGVVSEDEVEFQPDLNFY